MWKNNFKKCFSKINFKRAILVVMVIGIFVFSFYGLVKINKMNFWIKKECEKRVYTEYEKESKTPINNEQRIELEKASKECDLYQEYLNNKKAGSDKVIPILSLTGLPVNIKQAFRICFDKGGAEEIRNALSSGYKTEVVPDEEKRARSRKEVNDYQECLKNQKEAIKERPETYKFLIIVDLIILVIGLIVLKFW